MFLLFSLLLRIQPVRMEINPRAVVTLSERSIPLLENPTPRKIKPNGNESFQVGSFTFSNVISLDVLLFLYFEEKLCQNS